MKRVVFTLLIILTLTASISSCEQGNDNTYEQLQATDKEDTGSPGDKG